MTTRSNSRGSDERTEFSVGRDTLRKGVIPITWYLLFAFVLLSTADTADEYWLGVLYILSFYMLDLKDRLSLFHNCNSTISDKDELRKPRTAQIAGTSNAGEGSGISPEAYLTGNAKDLLGGRSIRTVEITCRTGSTQLFQGRLGPQRPSLITYACPLIRESCISTFTRPCAPNKGGPNRPKSWGSLARDLQRHDGTSRSSQQLSMLTSLEIRTHWWIRTGALMTDGFSTGTDF